MSKVTSLTIFHASSVLGWKGAGQEAASMRERNAQSETIPLPRLETAVKQGHSNKDRFALIDGIAAAAEGEGQGAV